MKWTRLVSTAPWPRACLGDWIRNSRHAAIAPDGQNACSPSRKNILLPTRRQTPSSPRRPVPTEGLFEIVTSAGRDAVAAAVSARNRDRRAGSTRERSQARRTNDAVADGEVLWS